MIKEKKKKSRYNIEKNKTQVLLEYFKTILCSFLVAVIFTTCLSIHARNEMIKDILNSGQEQSAMDRKVALEIINQTDLLKDLKNNFSLTWDFIKEI